MASSSSVYSLLHGVGYKWLNKSKQSKIELQWHQAWVTVDANTADTRLLHPLVPSLLLPTFFFFLTFP